MKTRTLLILVLLSSVSFAQQQRAVSLRNVYNQTSVNNPSNISNLNQRNYVSNVRVYNNVSNEDIQLDNNIPAQVRNELNNPNVEIEQMVIQQVYEQPQIQQRSTAVSRGNSQIVNNEVNEEIIEQNKRAERVREDKERALNLNLSDIQLPSPAPLFEDKEISLAKTRSVKPSIVKDEKTKRGKLGLEKGFYKKHIRNPLRSWFKRTFSKQKSFKAKLTCCFK